MRICRRDFIGAAGATLFSAVTVANGQVANGGKMYGLIGKMTAVPGKRDALIAILLDGISEMPGCLSYIVARDPADADTIWVTEVWDTEASHKASLAMPRVKKAIALGKPMIATFGSQTIIEPVGGHGLGF